MPIKTKKPQTKPQKKPLKIEPTPWEKQEGDTPRSFEAFSIYRDMGPARSFSKVTRELMTREAVNITQKPRKKRGSEKTRMRQLSKWSSKGNWVNRAGFWDAEQDRIERIENLKAVKEMSKRHAEESLIVQSKAITRLTDIDPADLTPTEALHYLSEAVKIERISRGAPDQKIEHSGEINTHETELDRMIAANPKTKAKINDILTELSTAESGGVRLSSK